MAGKLWTAAWSKTAASVTSSGKLTIESGNIRIGPAALSVGSKFRVERKTASLITLVSRQGKLATRVRVRLHSGGWLGVQVSVTNGSRKEIAAAPVDVLAVSVLTGFHMPGKASDMRMFVNGRWMADATGIRRLDGKRIGDFYARNEPTKRCNFEEGFRSWLVTAVFTAKQKCGVTMGFLQPAEESGHFGTEGKKFTARCGDIPVPLGPGKTRRYPELLVNVELPPDRALSAYAGLCPGRQRFTDAGEFTGWNSFDYYRSAENLNNVLENGRAIAKNCKLKKACRHLVVDASWETAWGEWYVKVHRFGSFRNIARSIRGLGFKPGIWTSPFVVERKASRIIRFHPDWFASDKDGRPFKTASGFYVLDPTHPGVEAYLTGVFKAMRAAGIEYFKADFLIYVLECAKFHKKDYSPTRALRHGLQYIRRAIGEQSFLLACIAPAECAHGIADAIRTGNDMHGYWSQAQMTCRQNLYRWWMHGKWFINDPDMFMVRGPETAKEPINLYPHRQEQPFVPMGWETGPNFSAREAETWMTSVLLVGGMFTFSDHMGRLKRRGRAILEKAAEARTSTGSRPLDFYRSFVPAVWLQPDSDRTRLAIINWYDDARTFTVDLADTDGLLSPHTRMKDLWTGKSFILKKKTSFRLGGRRSLYLLQTR